MSSLSSLASSLARKEGIEGKLSGDNLLNLSLTLAVVSTLSSIVTLLVSCTSSCSGASNVATGFVFELTLPI